MLNPSFAVRRGVPLLSSWKPIVPVLLSAVFCATPARAVELPPLLVRLGDHAARLERVYDDGAFTITSSLEQLDASGKAISTTNVVTRVQYTDGSASEEILKRVVDGKDVTEEAAKKRKREEKKAAAKGERLESQRLASPFEPDEQPKYQFKLLDPRPGDTDGCVRVGFKPKGKPSTDLYVGEAVVDPEKGFVKTFKSKPSKNPTFVDKIAIDLEVSEPTAAGPAPSTLKVDAEGGFLFYRKRVRVRSTFTDYVVPDLVSK